MKYKYKYSEVEAMRLISPNFEEIAKWCNGILQISDSRYVGIKIKASDGTEIYTYTGAWIVKYEDGTFHAFDNDLFILRFEPSTVSEPCGWIPSAYTVGWDTSCGYSVENLESTDGIFCQYCGDEKHIGLNKGD